MSKDIKNNKEFTLKHIGEVGLIAKIAQKFKSITPATSLLGMAEVIGIGDDCSIELIKNGEHNTDSTHSTIARLTTTDLLVEDIHFIREKIGGYALGHKLLAVNLSDIAAMGGTPLHYYLAMAFPVNTPLSFVEDFLQGLYDLSEKNHVSLLGGDTTKSPDKIVLNITVIGEAPNTNVKLRSAAKAEQYLCVTGPLGDSAAGLKLILEDLDNNERTNERTKKQDHSLSISKLISKHNLPTPRLQEGKFLSQFPSVGAMMDLSDGLSLDLDRLCKASKRDIRVDLEKLPLSEELIKMANYYHWDIHQLAVSGGEDYELLLTIDKNDYSQLAHQYQLQFGPLSQLTIIGETLPSTTTGTGNVFWFEKGQKKEAPPLGFDHFCS